MLAKDNKANAGKWIFISLFCIFLFFMALMIAGVMALFSGEEDFEIGNVAVISIDGVITADGGSSGIYGSSGTSSTETVRLIRKAADNPSIKAVIFKINSGGGSAVASDEIAHEIEKLNKTTVAWIREAGASGAYWIAASCDHIVANRMSVTGSIGVTSASIGLEGVMKKYNITYRRLVSGKYKDMGTPFREMYPDEEAKLLDELHVIHNYFVEHIKESRGIGDIDELWSAEIMLGERAKELGLIDEIGGIDEVTSYVEKQIGEPVQLVEYKRKQSILDIFSVALDRMSFSMGMGIGSSIIPDSEDDTIIWAR